MKRIFALLLTLSLLLSGCAGALEEQKQYTATFLTVFDTVTTIVGRDASEAVFTEKAQAIHDELLVYHQLFDIYNVYEGLNNLKTVNDHPGEAVTVDQAIIDLLLDCKHYYELTGGRVNAAMGSVLYLWHEAREDGLNDIANAYLPDSEALAEAAKHTSWDSILIDDEHNTVTITDPMLRLDVGAIAKGWSVQRVADNAPEGLLISVGGNVCATGAKDAAGTPWVVGIQNPDGGESYLHTLYLTRGSMVTSGDYQRAYLVDGEIYHHIIDPDTLYPGKLWRAVTVVCPDSGLADALSTALFLLPREEGQKLLTQCESTAMWVDADGKLYYSDGFEDLIRT
ncbi:MAG: FAD:protein FMN transferase [Oscillospiraceae bacterium]|nr:FAD:protein FMN transferase [Oscillospiraceae bacterium]